MVHTLTDVLADVPVTMLMLMQVDLQELLCWAACCSSAGARDGDSVPQLNILLQARAKLLLAHLDLMIPAAASSESLLRALRL